MEHARRIFQTVHVTILQERLSPVGTKRFINAVAKQKSVIEYRDLRLLRQKQFSIDVDYTVHRIFILHHRTRRTISMRQLFQGDSIMDRSVMRLHLSVQNGSLAGSVADLEEGALLL